MKASTLSSCPGVGWLQQWHCCCCGAQTGIRWPRGCGGSWVVALGMGQRAWGMGTWSGAGTSLPASQPQSCGAAFGGCLVLTSSWRGLWRLQGIPRVWDAASPSSSLQADTSGWDVAPSFWVLVPSTSGLWQWLGIKAAPAPQGHSMAFEAFYLGFVRCV